jgi:hypothetical protein
MAGAKPLSLACAISCNRYDLCSSVIKDMAFCMAKDNRLDPLLYRPLHVRNAQIDTSA